MNALVFSARRLTTLCFVVCIQTVNHEVTPLSFRYTLTAACAFSHTSQALEFNCKNSDTLLHEQQ